MRNFCARCSKCAVLCKRQNSARLCTWITRLKYPLAPYFGSDCKPCSVARQVHDEDKAHLVWQETLKLLDIPVECVEVAAAEADPADDPVKDDRYVETFPEVSNGEDLNFLLENGDDADDEFFADNHHT